MSTGTVDVRTRDTERHGKMRIDKLVEHLKGLDPPKSESYLNFYKNVWNPDNYKDIPLPEKKPVVEKQEEESKKE